MNVGLGCLPKIMLFSKSAHSTVKSTTMGLYTNEPIHFKFQSMHINTGLAEHSQRYLCTGLDGGMVCGHPELMKRQ